MASTRTERRQQAGDFVRLPGSRRPFRRVHEYHQRWIDALAAAGPLHIDQVAVARSFPPYVGRGHGGRHRTKNRIVGSQQFQDRSKYAPREENTKHLTVPSQSQLAKNERRRERERGWA